MKPSILLGSMLGLLVGGAVTLGLWSADTRAVDVSEPAQQTILDSVFDEADASGQLDTRPHRPLRPGSGRRVAPAHRAAQS